MRKDLPLPDPPPALTGDLERDADAALGWLWAHCDRWLDDDGNAERPDGRAA